MSTTHASRNPNLTFNLPRKRGEGIYNGLRASGISGEVELEVRIALGMHALHCLAGWDPTPHVL